MGSLLRQGRRTRVPSTLTLLCLLVPSLPVLAVATESTSSSWALAGTWTAKSAPGKRTFVISDSAVHWNSKLASPIVTKDDASFSTNLSPGAGLHDHCKLLGNELQWDNSDIWVRLDVDGGAGSDNSSGASGGGGGAGGAGGGGGGGPGGPSGSTGGGGGSGGGGGGAGQGGGQASVPRPNIEPATWTEEAHPGEHIYTIEGGQLSGYNPTPVDVSVRDDGSFTAMLGPIVTKGHMEDGKIHWQGEPGVWIPWTDMSRIQAEVTANLEGPWTRKSNPGEVIFIVQGTEIERLPDETVVNYTVVDNATISATIGGQNCSATLENGTLEWTGDEGIWIRLGENILLGMLDGLWTEKDRPGKHVYTISHGVRKGGGIPAGGIVVSLGNASLVVQTEFNFKEVVGIYKEKEIQWDDGRSAWIRWDASQIFAALNGPWTQEAHPGEHVYVIKDGTLTGAGTASVDVLTTGNGVIYTTLGGEKVHGTYREGKIHWEGDEGIWIPWRTKDIQLYVDGDWTDKQNPGQQTYHIQGGKLSGANPKPVVVKPTVDGGVETTIDGKPCKGKLQDGDLHWSCENRIWIRPHEGSEDNVEVAVAVAKATQTVYCSTPDIAWLPLDMASKCPTVEVDSSACFRRCQGEAGCAHFTYHEASKVCHLQDAFAKISYDAVGYVSGPPSCESQGGNNVNTTMIVLETAACYHTDSAYIAPPGVMLELPSTADTILECQNRCQASKKCQYFTYGALDTLCYLLGGNKTGGVKSVPVVNHVSGPKYCGQEVEFVLTIANVSLQTLEDADLTSTFRAALRAALFTNNKDITDFLKHRSAENHEVLQPLKSHGVTLVAAGENSVEASIVIGRDAQGKHDLADMLIRDRHEIELAVLSQLKDRFQADGGSFSGIISVPKPGELRLRGDDTNGQDKCTDSPQDWQDSEGMNCKSYVAGNLCTPTRGPGSGWNPDWGDFNTFATLGRTALQACCGCGGGSTNDPLPRPLAGEEPEVELHLIDKYRRSGSVLSGFPHMRLSGAIMLLVGGSVAAVGLSPLGGRVRRSLSRWEPCPEPTNRELRVLGAGQAYCDLSLPADALTNALFDDIQVASV